MATKIRTPEERALMRETADDMKELDEERPTAKQLAEADRLVTKCEAALDEQNDGKPVPIDVHGFSMQAIEIVSDRYRALQYVVVHDFDERVFREQDVNRLTIMPPVFKRSN